MRPLRLALLAGLCMGCHFDKLFNVSSARHAPLEGSRPAGLIFTTQPRSTAQNTAITPPVQVAAVDSQGSVLTGFTGSVFIDKGTDGSVFGDATLSGRHNIYAVNGVATFSDLRIDQAGTGYTLTAAIDSGVPLESSDPFNITPTVP